MRVMQKLICIIGKTEYYIDFALINKTDIYLVELAAQPCLPDWISSCIEAEQYFGQSVPEVHLVFGKTKDVNFIANAYTKGIKIYLNPDNRLLEYNCFKHAAIFHEYAHWIDLNRRNPAALQERESREIAQRLYDPKMLSEDLYDEYYANTMIPIRDRVWIYQMACVSFVGEKILERAEKQFGSVVYALNRKVSEMRLVRQMLPPFLALQNHNITSSFQASLKETDKKAYKRWKKYMKRVENKAPLHVKNQMHTLLIACRQIEPQCNYHFEMVAMVVPNHLQSVREVNKWLRKIARTLGRI